MHTFQFLTDKRLINLLNGGAVGVLPTDTVYGIVARAADPQAVKRLYGLKHREHKPGTVIAASIEQLVELGIKRRYLKAVEQLWPGPISVIIPCNAALNYLDLDKGSLAVRVPNDTELAALLEQTGALLTSSANLTGQPIANTTLEAQTYFADKVDFYVADGDLAGRKPSTIVRIVDDAIEVIRRGAGTIDEKGRIS